MMRPSKAVLIAFLFIFFSMPSLLIAADPSEDPFYYAGSSLSQIPSANSVYEYVDPFSGYLTLVHTDIFLPGNGGLDLALMRRYNSAIWSRRDTSFPGVVAANERSPLGIGWSMHMGIVRNPLGTGSGNQFLMNNPVVEMPDGSQHILYMNKNDQTTYISKDLWIYKAITTSTWTLTLTDGTVYTFECDGNVGYTTNDGVQVAQVTKIQNAAGTSTITISYEHDTNGNSNINTITDSVGRTIQFSYSNSLLSSISVGSRTFQYSYLTISSWDSTTPTNKFLSQVSVPAGNPWTYSYNTSTNTYDLQTITYPSGGTITYGYGNVYFDTGMSNVEFRVVTQRTAGGRDIPAGTWTYQYSSGGTSDNTTITGPGGLSEVHAFNGWGNNYSAGDYGSVWKIGRPISKTVYLNNSLILTEAFNWTQGTEISTNEEANAGWSGLGGQVYDNGVFIPELSSSSTTRDGKTYSTTYSNYDSYGNPGTIAESGDASRTTAITYWTNASLNIVKGKPASETVSGSFTGTFNTRHTYATNTGLPTSITSYGVNTNYSYYSDGNLDSVTDANGNTTLYQWSYGRISQIQPPQSGTTINKTINSNGTIASETNGRGYTTSYTYDGLLRVTSISPPAGYGNTTNYTYAADSSTKTETRGNYYTDYYYDGFGRPSGTSDIRGVSTTITYQSYGPKDYLSSNIGDTTNYDYFGRPTSIVHQDNTSIGYAYSGSDVTVTDEASYSTQLYYDAFGNPDEKLLGQVTDANGAITTYGYNILGSLIDSTQGSTSRTFSFDTTKNFLNSESSPEKGTITYGRDNVGNMTSMLDALGNQVYYGYDNNYRLTLITYGSNNLTFGYDGANNRTSMDSPAASINYTYDPSNRLTIKSETIVAQPYTTTYGYDDNDNITSIIYPSDTTLTYGYNNNNQVISVTGFGGSITPVSYCATAPCIGLPGSFADSSGQTTLLSYTPRNLTSQITTGSAVSNVQYGYTDTRGNMTSITDNINPSLNQTMTYDNLSRLYTFDGSWGSGSLSYNTVGDRLLKTVAGVNTSYSYSSNRLTSTSGGEAATFSYYNSGDLQSLNGVSLTIDMLHNVTSYNGVSFAYDGDGMRVTKSSGGNTVVYHYDKDGRLLSEDGGNGVLIADYIYLNGKLVAMSTSQAQPSSYTVTPSAGAGGSISPNTVQTVLSGSSVSFTITPNAGYQIAGVSVDGVLVGAVSSYTFSNVTANHTISATFTAAPSLTGLALSPASVVGGSISQGTITLSAPASSGALVTLISNNPPNNPSVVTVPASVIVEAGQTFASFTITTAPVSNPTSVTITATYDAVAQSATLAIGSAPPPTLFQLTLNQTSVTGGNAWQGTVTLSTPAPSGGAAVILQSTNTATGIVYQIGTVTIPENSRSYTFTINTTAVSSDTSWIISASYLGATLTADTLLTIQPPTPEGTFSDVPSSYWAFDDIEAIYQAGITVGCGNGDYCPSENVTRDQMAAFLIRALYGENFICNGGVNCATETPYFSDVPATDYFFPYIQKLYELSITTGCGNGDYCPSAGVTRDQMAAFLIRALQVIAGQDTENFSYTSTPPYFGDVPSTDPFFKYVQKLKDDNITTVAGSYNPTQITPRDQMAAFITRAFLTNAIITSTFTVYTPPVSREAHSSAPPGALTWTTPGSYTWTVPSGVTSIAVDVQGAEGSQGGAAGYDGTFGGLGGYGARVQATLAVTAGQTLVILVGDESNDQSGGYNGGGTGGNGGGNGGGYGGGGGGFSSIAAQDGSLLAVAGGGGGGGGSYASFRVGGAGGSSDQNGIQGATAGGVYAGTSGIGGTQSAAGNGGVSSPNPADGSGLSGNSSTGGNGGALSGSGDYGAGGGGGGGGYYAGGGGSANGAAGDGGGGAGGGGGSSWTNGTNVIYTAGYNSGSGYVSISTSSSTSSTTYTVTPSAGSGGSISPNTAQTVNSGSTASFTVTPSSGYSTSSVTGCGGTLSGSTYTTGAITGNCAVSATFTSGSSSSPGSQTYTAGQSGTFTVPSGVTQITVTMWGGGGSGNRDSSGSNISSGAGAGSMVNYNLSVTPGNSIAYSVGFGGASVTTNYTSGNNGGNTTFGPLIAYGGAGSYYADHGGTGGNATDGTNTATGGNGAVHNAGTGVGFSGQTVSAGGGTLYGGGGGGGYGSLAWAAGGNGESAGGAGGSTSWGGGGGGSYGVGGTGDGGSGTQGSGGVSGLAVASGKGGDGQIQLTWSGQSPTTYTVTPSAGSGGSISPNTAQTVNSGSTASFTVTPSSGYSTSSVTGCGGTLSGSTYTTGAITGNCAVSATFTSGSSSSPGSQTYTAGQSGTFTVPSGVTQITVTMWGGGAGGYTGESGSSNGDGGGGAGSIVGYNLTVTPGQNINYSVGAGGLGGQSQNALGVSGGSTLFGTLIAYGGQPGTAQGYGGTGGNATDGTYTANGGAEGTTSANGGNGQQVSAGGGMLYGGGGGGEPFAYSTCSTGLGGTSYSNTTACGGYGGGGGASYGSGGSGYESSSQADSGVNGGGGAGLWAASGYVAGKGGNGQIQLTW